MYVMYYDSGTTNTRGYLLKDGVVVRKAAEAIGAKNSALEKDNTRLVGELHAMFERLTREEGIPEAEVAHVYLSGMISSPSGIVEVEHLPLPVNCGILKNAIVTWYDGRFFHRELEIIPGLKTLERGARVSEADAARINMMRGEEIEIFGILRQYPEYRSGDCILVLPGSHTQAAWLQDGSIVDISSNITGELYKAVMQDTILGASAGGDEPWEIDGEMVCLGGNNVHAYGLNRALYILRTMDLFTDASLNRRRSYLEGVLNVGVMDAVSRMLEKRGAAAGPMPLVIAGDGIQKEIYRSFCDSMYPGFRFAEVSGTPELPYSVSGLLELCGLFS